MNALFCRFRKLLAAGALASTAASGAPAPFVLLHSLVDPSTNAQMGAQQGWSVAVDGNIAVVGAPYSDTSGPACGVVKVYDVTTGALLHTLLNPSADNRDLFGGAVAISGTSVVVGRAGDTALEWRPGDAYVYDLASVTPAVPVLALANPTPGAGVFGYSVGISGTRVVVGAPYDESAEPAAGSAYVYDLASPTPTEPIVTFHNPSPVADDRFGWSVAISDGRVAIGAVLDNTGAEDAGRVHVYDLSRAVPSTPDVTLTNPAPTAFDQFGFSVAISGSRVVIGARYNNTGAVESGSAYVYDLAGASPSVPVATLTNPSPAMFDNFGFAVAISGPRVVIGALGDRTGASAAGSAYVYDLTAATLLSPVTTLNNPSPAAGDYFGWCVALSGARVIVGAPNDDAGAIDAGSAYAYDLAAGTPTVPVAILNKPSLASGGLFGYAMAVSGRWVAVGVPVAETAYVYDLTDLTSATVQRPVLALTNPIPLRSDGFGQAVALTEARLVVGVPGANCSYVYALASTTPTPTITLTNPGPPLGDFGFAVAAFGSRTVVGAPNSGSAYVYDSAGPAPAIPRVNLSNRDPMREDRFGVSVAISGSYVVVGAPWDDTGAPNAGSVYVYDLASPSPRAPVVVLRDPTPEQEAYFGTSVAISGTHVVVGAYRDSLDIGAAGAAYVFDMGGADPTRPLATLTSPKPAQYDYFGYSVAISGRRVVVGAFLDDTGATDTGIAFVYDLSSASPASPVATLINPVSATGDNFGNAVAIDDTTIVVGAPADNTKRGAAYIFGLRPTLRLSSAGSSFVTLSWTPATAPGFVLQHADGLAPRNWVNAASGAANPITIPTTNTARFYRLVQP